MWKEYQRHNNHLLLILFSFPNLGCLVAKKTQLFYCFSNCFQWIFLRKKKLVDSSFIYLSISNLFGFECNSFSSYRDPRRGRDRVWCGLKECSKRRRCATESERCQSSGLGRIGRFELGKTLYSVFILHSGYFLSVVDPWFLISSEIFYVNFCVTIAISHSSL